MRMRILLGVIILSLAFSVAAFAAVENIKVSGDITTQGISRNLTMGSDTNGGGGDYERFMLSQIRLRFDADLTENVSAVVSLINERVWGREDIYHDDTNVSLDLGYVELRECLYQPLTVTVGRQTLRYGNALIIGDSDTNIGTGNDFFVRATDPDCFGDLSLRKSFDAVKAVIDFAPFTIDTIYAQIEEQLTTRNRDDIALFGTNVNYQWSSFNGATEGYFFVSNNGTSAIGNTPGNTAATDGKDSYTCVVGGRVQFDPIDKLTLGLEGAYQFGDAWFDTAAPGDGAPDTYDHLSAWAIQAMGEYRFLNDYNVILGGTYTYLSGDDDLDDNEYNAWDPLYEDQTPAEIINVLGGNTNAHLIKVTGSFMPREDITLGAVYAHSILAENWHYATYSTGDGPTSANVYNVDRDERNFGGEVDIYGLYDYTEDVQLKVLGAWFVPGAFFDDDNTAYSLRTALTVNF